MDSQIKQRIMRELHEEAVGLLKRMTFSTEHGGSVQGARVHIMADPRWDPVRQIYTIAITCYAAGFDQTYFAGMPWIVRPDISAFRDLREGVKEKLVLTPALESGDLLNAKGDFDGALAQYRAALEDDQQRSAAQPDEANLQALLAVEHERMGDVLNAQGEFSRALVEYRAALAIDQQLASEHGATEIALRIANNHAGIGDVLFAKGDMTGALSAYREAASINEQLLTNEPTSTPFRRALVVNQMRVSAALAGQGQLQEAQALQHSALELDQQTVEQTQSFLPVFALLPATTPTVLQSFVAGYIAQLDSHGHAVFNGVAPGEYRFNTSAEWLVAEISTQSRQTYTPAGKQWQIDLRYLPGERWQLKAQSTTPEYQGREITFAFLDDAGAILRSGLLTLSRQRPGGFESQTWEDTVLGARRLVSYI